MRSRGFIKGFQGSYIENQQEWKGIRFGWHPGSNLADTGCGVFAAYNVLFDAGRIRSGREGGVLEELICSFERFGAVFGGRLGVSVFALYLYFKRHFPKAGLCLWHNAYRQNSFGLKYDAFVATIVNERVNPFKGLHTVCITKKDRRFFIHNAYRRTGSGSFRQSEPYDSLSDALSHITKNPFFVDVIGIKYH